MQIPLDKQDKLHGCLEHLFNQVGLQNNISDYVFIIDHMSNLHRAFFSLWFSYHFWSVLFHLSVCPWRSISPSFLPLLSSPTLQHASSDNRVHLLYLPILTFDLYPLLPVKDFSRFAAGRTEGRIHCCAVCVFPRSGRLHQQPPERAGHEQSMRGNQAFPPWPHSARYGPVWGKHWCVCYVWKSV